MAQEGTKRAPSVAQDGPEWPLEGRKTAQEIQAGPKTAQDWPKTAPARPQEGPKTAQEAPKTTPRDFHDRPGGPQDGSSMAPRCEFLGRG